MLGLDEAFERFYRENPKGLSGAADRSEPKPKPTATPTASPTGARPTSELLPQSDAKATTTGAEPTAVLEAIDKVIEVLLLEHRWVARNDGRSRNAPSGHAVPIALPQNQEDKEGLAAVITVAILAGEWARSRRYTFAIKSWTRHAPSLVSPNSERVPTRSQEGRCLRHATLRENPR